MASISANSSAALLSYVTPPPTPYDAVPTDAKPTDAKPTDAVPTDSFPAAEEFVEFGPVSMQTVRIATEEMTLRVFRCWVDCTGPTTGSGSI